MMYFICPWMTIRIRPPRTSNNFSSNTKIKFVGLGRPRPRPCPGRPGLRGRERPRSTEPWFICSYAKLFIVMGTIFFNYFEAIDDPHFDQCWFMLISSLFRNRYFLLRRLFAAISQSAVVFSQFFRSVSAVWTKHIQNREAKCDKNHINQSIYEIGETAVSQWVHSLSLPTLTWKWVIYSISMSKRMILILYALSQVLTSVRLWNQLQANCLFKQWWNFSWFI